MNRIQVTILNMGRITGIKKFDNIYQGLDFVDTTFPEAKRIRFDPTQDVYKDAEGRTNIIVSPLTYDEPKMTDEQCIEALIKFNSKFGNLPEPSEDPEFEREYAELTMPRQEWLKLIDIAYRAATLDAFLQVTVRDHKIVSALINASEAPGFHHPSCFVS